MKNKNGADNHPPSGRLQAAKLGGELNKIYKCYSIYKLSDPNGLSKILNLKYSSIPNFL